jgi:hypothetical protein
MDRMSYSREIDMVQLDGTLAYWGSVAQYQGTSLTNPQTPFMFTVGATNMNGSPADVAVAGFLEFEIHLSTPTLLTA